MIKSGEKRVFEWGGEWAGFCGGGIGFEFFLGFVLGFSSFYRLFLDITEFASGIYDNNGIVIVFFVRYSFVCGEFENIVLLILFFLF